jgi:hypothetical protein
MNHMTKLPTLRPLAALLALALASATGTVAAQALTPAFTYQGELRLASGPATAPFDMQFRLFNAASDGAQIGSTITANNVAVTGGLFSVPLNFGVAQFAGERQWLEIAIRPAGSGTFETLSPRTEVTAAPYAWSAAVALANSVTTTSIVDGTIGTADINAAQVQRRVSGTCPTGQYVRIVNQDGTVTCGTDANAGGTLTNIATGAGLTGGPITATGTISVAPGGIGTTQINATQVQRRVGGTCAVGSYVRQVNEDGTVVCGTDATGTDWSLGGNAGTNPATNFIGTTDAQPLVFRTANARSLRIEPSSITFGTPALPITTNTIAGSHANEVTAGVRGATIAGGGVPSGDSDPELFFEEPNRVSDHYGTIGGGYGNVAGNDDGTVSNTTFATVGGGIFNIASGLTSTVDGGFLNTASAIESTVGGGSQNNASGLFGTVGGGNQNTASGPGSAVGGGERNTASGGRSTVGGGTRNTASAAASTVGGGDSNTAGGGNSAVGGGIFNAASGGNSAVGGGASNTASGVSSTVGGGISNCAGGSGSWAGGSRAKVRPGTSSGAAGTGCSGVPSSSDADGDNGTFVWADSQTGFFVSTGPNQFLVRAGGGAAINSNDPAGNALRVAGTLRVDTLGTAAATTLCRNADNQISACSSSARYKSDIADLELGLATALRLHAVGYRWKDTGAADVGFVAEEIAKIDERLVTRNAAGEIEGVKYDRLTAVLANAVQELAARDSLASEDVAQVRAENAELSIAQDRLKSENAELRARHEQLASENAALQSRLAAIEARLGLSGGGER